MTGPSHCNLATLLQCYIATLLHFYIATMLYCYIATMQHCYIPTLLHCCIATLLSDAHCKFVCVPLLHCYLPMLHKTSLLHTIAKLLHVTAYLLLNATSINYMHFSRPLTQGFDYMVLYWSISKHLHDSKRVTMFHVAFAIL